MKFIGLKILLSLVGVTTVRRVCWVEQLACSTPQENGMNEGVHGKFPLAVLEFNKFGKSRRISAQNKNTAVHEYEFNISQDVI